MKPERRAARLKEGDVLYHLDDFDRVTSAEKPYLVGREEQLLRRVFFFVATEGSRVFYGLFYVNREGKNVVRIILVSASQPISKQPAGCPLSLFSLFPLSLSLPSLLFAAFSFSFSLTLSLCPSFFLLSLCSFLLRFFRATQTASLRAPRRGSFPAVEALFRREATSRSPKAKRRRSPSLSLKTSTEPEKRRTRRSNASKPKREGLFC